MSGHGQVRMSKRYRLKGPARSPTSYGVKRGHNRHGKAISRNIRAAASVSRSVKGGRGGDLVRSPTGGTSAKLALFSRRRRVRVTRAGSPRGPVDRRIVYIPFKLTSPAMRSDSVFHTGKHSGKWTRGVT